MGARAIIDNEFLIHMQLNNVHLEDVRGYVLTKLSIVVHDALHLYGTFVHTRRLHGFRFHWRESRISKFVGLKPISPAALLFRNGIFSGGQRQPIYKCH